jgi:hypothetical protein
MSYNTHLYFLVHVNCFAYRCGLESRHRLGFLLHEEAIWTTNLRKVGGPTQAPVRAWRVTRGLPPPIKLENCYMTLLYWCDVLMSKN